MKIALLLSIVSAAAIISGCSTTNTGGTADEYNTTSGTMQSQPVMTDPSLPDNPNVGPSIPPP
ncbi:MAG TPA: hypothetical protein VG938_13645 [Verrucomicrobiae bacterium]|jgi:hypothetical protein|nr:hypothetical protein [Verrucomicrobiae bacterium]